MHWCMSVKPRLTEAAGGTSRIILGVVFHYPLDLITVIVWLVCIRAGNLRACKLLLAAWSRQPTGSTRIVPTVSLLSYEGCQCNNMWKGSIRVVLNRRSDYKKGKSLSLLGLSSTTSIRLRFSLSLASAIQSATTKNWVPFYPPCPRHPTPSSVSRSQRGKNLLRDGIFPAGRYPKTITTKSKCLFSFMPCANCRTGTQWITRCLTISLAVGYTMSFCVQSKDANMDFDRDPWVPSGSME